MSCHPVRRELRANPSQSLFISFIDLHLFIFLFLIFICLSSFHCVFVFLLFISMSNTVSPSDLSCSQSKQSLVQSVQASLVWSHPQSVRVCSRAVFKSLSCSPQVTLVCFIIHSGPTHSQSKQSLVQSVQATLVRSNPQSVQVYSRAVVESLSCGWFVGLSSVFVRY